MAGQHRNIWPSQGNDNINQTFRVIQFGKDMHFDVNGDLEISNILAILTVVYDKMYRMLNQLRKQF